MFPGEIDLLDTFVALAIAKGFGNVKYEVVAIEIKAV